MIHIPAIGCLTLGEFNDIKKANAIEERERIRCGENPTIVKTEREVSEIVALKTVSNIPRCD